MLKRLILLKPFVNQLIDTNMIFRSYALHDNQWSIAKKYCTILTPFKFFQELLEGEYYSTLPIVAVALLTLRQKLCDIIDDANNDDDVAVSTLVTALLQKFDAEFQPDASVSFFNSYRRASNDRNYKSRKVGISIESMLATALDPRTKHLVVIPVHDDSIQSIWEEIEKKCFILRHRVRTGYNISSKIVWKEPTEVRLLTDAKTNFMSEIVAKLKPQAPGRMVIPLNPDEKIKQDIRNEIEQYKVEELLDLLCDKVVEVDGEIQLSYPSTIPWNGGQRMKTNIPF